VFLSCEGRDGAAKLIYLFKRGVYYCREEPLFERERGGGGGGGSLNGGGGLFILPQRKEYKM
jgi:hypothetical protein